MQMITVTNMQIRWFLRNLQLIGLVLKGWQLGACKLEVHIDRRRGYSRLQQPNLEDPIAAEVRFAWHVLTFSLNPRVHPCKHVKLYNVSEKHFGHGS